ncbi:S-layer homology domain-containing protein [Chengkuizengella sp. SCS-71B]|uniref:S-layer homology domain-containing protein n=1 Tax=Chengkuizengella sp. SCS-71B TaxID=3115290 RepID=UPI0032C2301D
MREKSSHDSISNSSNYKQTNDIQGGETKVMKKSLSILLAISMVFSMFASVAFAAEDEMTTEEKYEALEDKDIFNGYDDGLPHLEDNMTREQAAKIIALVFGLEDADAEEPTFSDVASDRWSYGFIEAAAAAGIIEGVGNGAFDPKAEVTIEQFAKMLVVGYANLTGMEYDEEATVDNENVSAWAQPFVAVALDWELIAEQEDYTVSADRAFLVEAAYATDTVVVAYTDKPQVVSVSSPNLVTVEVELSNVNGLNASQLENEKNYGLKNSDDESIEIGSVSLDGTELTISLAEVAPNQDSGTLTIDAKVLGTEEDVVVEDIEFFDAEIPVAKDIELIGPNKFKVLFSEPLNPEIDDAEIEVEDGIYGVVGYTIEGNAVTVELSVDSLSEGEYKVVVAGFEDYAEFKALKKKFTLDYKKVKSVPTAEVTDASQVSVEITFDRPLDVDVDDADFEEYFYHTFSSYNPAEVTSSNNQKFVLDFSNNPLPEGKVKVVVNYDADEELEDEWGNELVENLEFFVEISADKTKPTVTKVVAGDSEEFVLVHFSEDVVTKSAEDEDNYVVKDSDGDEVSIYDIEYTNDNNEYIAEIEFVNDLSGDYTIEISDVDDKALETNTLKTVTLSFSMNDKSAMSLETAIVEGIDGASDEEDVIYITFPEKMATSGEFSVLDKDNYLLNGEQLASKDKISLFGDSSQVKIVVENGNAQEIEVSDPADAVELTIARVADAAGNKTKKLAHTFDVGEVKAPKITAIKTVDKKTIEITVDKPLKTVTKTGFKVTNGTSDTLAAVSYKIDGTNTIITGTLKADQQLADSGDINIELEVDAEKLKSFDGKYMENDTYGDDPGEDITDGFAPSLDKDNVSVNKATKEITLDFTEDIKLLNDLAAIDLVIKDHKKDELTAGIDYTVSVDSGNLVIKLEASGSYGSHEKELEISTVDKVKYITDDTPSANKIKAFEDVEVDFAP